MSAPGSSCWSPARAPGWWTASRRSETTLGLAGFSMSMIRAAPTGADACGRAAVEAEVRELVDLEQVVPALAGERLGHLRQRPLRPVEVGDDLDLRVRPPVLDLGHVEDAQTTGGEPDAARVADVGDVHRPAVRREPQAVVVDAGLEEHPLRVARVRRRRWRPGSARRCSRRRRCCRRGRTRSRGRAPRWWSRTAAWAGGSWCGRRRARGSPSVGERRCPAPRRAGRASC